jgi:hypothetical protein
MVTDFRSIASFTRRSASSRISCFDIRNFRLLARWFLHEITRGHNKHWGFVQYCPKNPAARPYGLMLQDRN